MPKTRSIRPAAYAAAVAASALLPAAAGAQTPGAQTAGAPTLAGAPVLQERNIPLAAARVIAQGAVDACSSRGYRVTAAVVDRAGVARAVLRADGADRDTVRTASAKGYTSAAFRNSTSALAQAAASNPAQRNLGQIRGALLVGGGLPVRVEDEVIGAVGVSGAPNAQADEECARAGIERAQSATAAATASAAGAQPLAGRDLSLAAAVRIAQGAVDSCLGRNFGTTAAVVDRTGVLRALLRADRAGVATPASGSDKAYTSVVLRDSTSTLVQNLQNRPRQERELNETPGILLLGGGLPVRFSGDIVGGVGVGGAPSGQIDEECARAGIAAGGSGLS
jgi:uncharacterized protein GlcG (DUF336 family)